MICELFPEKNPGLNGYASLIFLNFCKDSSKFDNRIFPKCVVFVVFVAFFGYHGVVFTKSSIRAFRKVYGLWGYIQPLKSYGRFKFPNTTVTHVCFKVWYVLGIKINYFQKLERILLCAIVICSCGDCPQLHAAPWEQTDPHLLCPLCTVQETS